MSGGVEEERDHNVSFFLEWMGGSPQGFFLDGARGEALIRIPRVECNFTARLMVGAVGVRSAIAANLTFMLLPTDVDEYSGAVGPGGQNCFNNGTRTDRYDGESEFDGHFSCTCKSGFDGVNCEIDLAAAAAAHGADSSTDTVAYSVVGATLALLVVAVMVARYQVSKSR